VITCSFPCGSGYIHMIGAHVNSSCELCKRNINENGPDIDRRPLNGSSGTHSKRRLQSAEEKFYWRSQSVMDAPTCAVTCGAPMVGDKKTILMPTVCAVCDRCWLNCRVWTCREPLSDSSVSVTVSPTAWQEPWQWR